VTSIQFEQDGDVVTADSDGFITVYSVDADGAYFVRMEFEAHNKGISSLVMLSEGTLLSGGEKDRKIAAWDSLQNYKRITDTKVEHFKEFCSILWTHLLIGYMLTGYQIIFTLLLIPFFSEVYIIDNEMKMK